MPQLHVRIQAAVIETDRQTEVNVGEQQCKHFRDLDMNAERIK